MSDTPLFDPDSPDAAFPARFSHFTLLKKLGAGGMGTTFLAEDDTLGRKVAIKVMQRQLGEDAAAFEAFKNEAQNAARLNHPNIVQVYSFGQENGCPFLEMELVPGGDLGGLMENPGHLDPAFVMRVGFEIAQGLKAAEEGGLFHGDVKPDNILFDENRVAKLVDFGIASRANAGAGEEVWGTPYYIAPEKVQKKTDSARSDIFSLGATLYHAIAGVPPFDGETPVDVVKARFKGPAKPLAEVRPDVDPEIARIITRMMYTDLFMRYPNYNSLLGDFRKVLATFPDVRKKGPVGMIQGTVKSTTGAVRDTATAESTTNTGKRKFVIQKGQVENGLAVAAATNATKITLRPASTPAASTPAPGLSPEQRRAQTARKVRMMAILLSVVIAAVVGTLGYFFVKKISEEKRAERLNLQYQADAESLLREIEALAPAFDKALARMNALDAQMGKKYDEAVALILKTTGLGLEKPDLEPPPEPEPTPEADPASADASEGANGAAADPLAPILQAAAVKDNEAIKGLISDFVGRHPEILQDTDLLRKATTIATNPSFAGNPSLLENALKSMIQAYETASGPGGTPAVPAAVKATARSVLQAYIKQRSKEAGYTIPTDLIAAEARQAGLTPEEYAKSKMGDAAEAEETEEDSDAAEEAEEEAEAPAEPQTEEARDFEALRAVVGKTLDPSARAIRKALRDCEKIKASAEALDERAEVKPTDPPVKTYQNRKGMFDDRTAALERMQALAAEAEKVLRTDVAKGMIELRRAAEPINRRRIRQEEERRKQAAAEAKAAEERAERERIAGIRAEEIQRIEDVCAKYQSLVDAFQYDKFVETISRMQAELTQPEARETLATAVKRIEAVKDLRTWIFEDLRRNGELLNGWHNRYDILGVSVSAPELLISHRQPNVPMDKLTLADWAALVWQLLENRPPVRHGLSPLDRGTQLFNAAIFCYIHGNGNPLALERSKKLATEAFKYRSALRADVKKFLPFYEETPAEDSEEDATDEATDEVWE